MVSSGRDAILPCGSHLSHVDRSPVSSNERLCKSPIPAPSRGNLCLKSMICTTCWLTGILQRTIATHVATVIGLSLSNESVHNAYFMACHLLHRCSFCSDRLGDFADGSFRWPPSAKPGRTTGIAKFSLSRRKGVGLANRMDTARVGAPVDGNGGVARCIFTVEWERSTLDDRRSPRPEIRIASRICSISANPETRKRTCA